MWRSSRDSARTLMQWDATENAGFTTSKPWFYANPNYTRINVAQQEEDPDSILRFYREAIHLRKSLPAVRHGAYKEHFRRSRQHYVFSRETPEEKLLVICSFTDRDTALKIPAGFDLSKAELILTNYRQPSERLRPYEARVYLWCE